MSDSVTLIAGILLTLVGLLALMPYVLKRGQRDPSAVVALESQLSRAGISPFEGESDEAGSRVAAAPGDIDALLAHLFSLRMTVSEVAADVQVAHEAIRAGHGDWDDASDFAMPADDVA